MPARERARAALGTATRPSDTSGATGPKTDRPACACAIAQLVLARSEIEVRLYLAAVALVTTIASLS